ncbi:MAG: hypothetical protein Q4A19_07230 [Johnsonella sp.]|nr:hypothetical protein [Johnsonella sp.]
MLEYKIVEVFFEKIINDFIQVDNSKLTIKNEDELMDYLSPISLLVVVCMLEKEFGIAFKNNDITYENFRSKNSLIKLILKIENEKIN